MTILQERDFYTAISTGDVKTVELAIEEGFLNDPTRHLEALKHSVVFNQIAVFNMLADHHRSDGNDIFEYQDNFGNALIHWMSTHPMREIPFVEPVAKRMKNLDITNATGRRAVELFALNHIQNRNCTADFIHRGYDKREIEEFGSEILIRLGAKPTPEGVVEISDYAKEKADSDKPESEHYPDVIATRKRLLEGLELSLTGNFAAKAAASRRSGTCIDMP